MLGHVMTKQTQDNKLYTIQVKSSLSGDVLVSKLNKLVQDSNDRKLTDSIQSISLVDHSGDRASDHSGPNDVRAPGQEPVGPIDQI